MTEAKKPSNIKLIKDFFGMTAKEAMAEAKALTDQDKEELAAGITSGTLTY